MPPTLLAPAPTPAPTASANRLLAALPRKDYQRILTNCDTVELSFGEVLTEAGERIRYLYFPSDSYISLVTPIDGHAGLEVGLVGEEGMLGTSLILGVDRSPLRAVVQGGGQSLRINTAQFCRELEQSPALHRELNHYLYVLMSQMAQSAACTRFHLVEARLARLLLMSQDRAHSKSFHVTHEFLAYMLGVRRVGVTKAATSLQNRKLISYSRGDITIADRNGLEAAACECYVADKSSYKRVMGY